MPATLTIRDETLGGETLHEWALEVLTERITVRELIRSRVYQEVQDHNRKRAENPAATYRGLVRPVSDEEVLNGTKPKAIRPLDWKAQYEAAIEAFGQNRVLILVNDRQVESVDEEIELAPGASVAFVKLAPLVGG